MSVLVPVQEHLERVLGLALVDMVKGIDRTVWIGSVALQEKTGGRSGTWRRGEAAR